MEVNTLSLHQSLYSSATGHCCHRNTGVSHGTVQHSSQV